VNGNLVAAYTHRLEPVMAQSFPGLTDDEITNVDRDNFRQDLLTGLDDTVKFGRTVAGYQTTDSFRRGFCWVADQNGYGAGFAPVRFRSGPSPDYLMITLVATPARLRYDREFAPDGRPDIRQSRIAVTRRRCAYVCRQRPAAGELRSIPSVTSTEIGALPLSIRRAPGWVDPVLAVLAAALAVTVLVSADIAAIDPALRPATAIAVGATAVGAAGTAWRRRNPLLGLAMVTGAAIIVSAGWHFTGVLPYLTMLALYSVAAYGTRRQAIAGLSLIIVSFGALLLAGVPDLTPGDVATSVAVCVAAAGVGDAVRQRRAHHVDTLAAAEARAEGAAQRAVAEERLRIARELHDVVAHSMSLIAVQAGVGAHLLHDDPKAAEQALAVIAETSRTALTQTRSVVGLLRSGDEGQPGPPGLVSLDALVQGVRDAGLLVDVTLAGTPRTLPALVDLAAYRVVQEALTNAVKHAPRLPVTVRITYAPAALLIDVRGAETTPAGTPVVPGFGLIGLHERARSVGGRLEAGPGADGGFRVQADLPTDGDAG
jgi:signal transduction histidine kinase